MAAATTTRLTEMSPGAPARITLGSAANQEFFKGTLVARDAAGRAVVPTDGVGFEIMGWANAYFDNRTGSDAGGLADDLQIQITPGVGDAECADSVTIGQALYSVDNQTVSTDSSAGARGFAGYATEQRNGKTYFYAGPINVVLAAALS